MKVVFRVDASPKIGSGHLMRCLTLAGALREQDADIRFMCSDLAGNMNALPTIKGFAVSILPRVDSDNLVSEDLSATDAAQAILALGADKPDWIIVDHYGLDVRWEQSLRAYTKHIMVIEDHPGRHHDCDILLDQNYSAEGTQRYDGFIPPTCNVLLGAGYALLRKEFGELRKRVRRRSRIENLLVFFTAGNDQGETLKAMQGVVQFGKATQVDVVVGCLNPHNVAIKSKCDELHWGYHCQVDYMPALIAKADLVIGAGGASNWERCALGAPALVTILADNQVLIAKALNDAGAVRNLGWCHGLTSADYSDALLALNENQLSGMSERALHIVDGAGTQRVVDALLMNS